MIPETPDPVRCVHYCIGMTTLQDTAWIDRSILDRVPERPAILVRISDDTLGLEKGVTRQWADGKRVMKREGWKGSPLRVMENDTSAYKRRWVTLSDGSRVKRVVRPEFDELLRQIYAGEVDGLIVYDLDRLVRQNRQLEDLIDAVEQMRIPVHSASGGMVNLLTGDGRANARMMCTMATKQSDDTARRVARTAFSLAEEGSVTRGGPRRFGWQSCAVKLEDAEATAIREAARRATDGESLWSIVVDFQARGITPVDPPRKKRTEASGQFTRSSLNNLLRSPRIGGIRIYAGTGRGRAVPINDWRNRVMVKDGAYVMGKWVAVLPVAEWEELQHALDSPKRHRSQQLGQAPVGGANARKYLLTGWLRCGACGGRMNGKPGTERRRPYYQCKPKDQGGCNSVSRDMGRVDALVTELLMRAMEADALVAAEPDLDAEQRAAAESEIGRLSDAKAAARAHWQPGVNDEDYFADRDVLSAKLKAAQAVLSAQPVRRRRSVKNPREAWAAGNLSQKRAMIAEHITHVTIMPQASQGRWGWRDEYVQPSWLREGARSEPDVQPSSQAG